MPISRAALVFLDDDTLLDLIIQECAELIYVASKAKRFGLEDVNPNKPDAESNVCEIALENAQLVNSLRALLRVSASTRTTCSMRSSVGAGARGARRRSHRD